MTNIEEVVSEIEARHERAAKQLRNFNEQTITLTQLSTLAAIITMQSDRATLLKLVKPLLEYIKRQGHVADCSSRCLMAPDYMKAMPCDCGYDKALAAIKEVV